jgi:hypothetical protein
MDHLAHHLHHDRMQQKDPFEAALANLHPATGDSLSSNASKQSVADNGHHHSEGHDAARDQSKGPTQAEEARQRLAEEALLANPAEMRRQFPDLLKVLDKNHDGKLNQAEVFAQTNTASLSVSQRAFLAILQKGYGDLSRGFGQLPGNGCINNDCLAVVDKAINRNINDDPLFANRAIFNLGTSVLSGAAIGLIKTEGNGKAKLAGAATTALEMTTTSEGELLIKKWNGDEDRDYDLVKERYLSFKNKWSS